MVMQRFIICRYGVRRLIGRDSPVISRKTGKPALRMIMIMTLRVGFEVKKSSYDELESDSGTGQLEKKKQWEVYSEKQCEVHLFRQKDKSRIVQKQFEPTKDRHLCGTRLKLFIRVSGTDRQSRQILRDKKFG